MSYKKEVLVSLQGLNILKQDEKEVSVKAKYGPSKPTRIPLFIDEFLACFVAAIIGDGHLRKDKFQIVLDGFNQDNILSFQKISNDLFKRNFNIMTIKEEGKDSYRLVMDSKAVYVLLNKIFEV